MSATQLYQSQCEGFRSNEVKDQYAEGEVARVCGLFIDSRRTQNYKDTLTGMLKKHGCNRILDAACGTGIDSIMLIEEGFKVVSIDASDKMLKHAIKARWEKRKESNYDEWIIEEANWETLPSDIKEFLPGTQFDAIICLGNSFSHVLDDYGDQRTQKMCLNNFNKCLKPGGLLFIDHRNFDAMLNDVPIPTRSIYYDWECPRQIKKSLVGDSGKPKALALDYYIQESTGMTEFRLYCYPHKLEEFTKMLDEAFDNHAKHHIYADFKPMDQVPLPGFYIHVLEKAKD